MMNLIAIWILGMYLLAFATFEAVLKMGLADYKSPAANVRLIVIIAMWPLTLPMILGLTVLVLGLRVIGRLIVSWAVWD